MFCNISVSQIVVNNSQCGILSNSQSIASCYTMESHIEVDKKKLHILYGNLHIVVGLGKNCIENHNVFMLMIRSF